jgi:lysozyme
MKLPILSPTSIGIVALMGASGCASEASTEAVGSGSAELQVCATGTPLKGVDVSEHNQEVDFHKVKSSGRSFAFARVSDGLPDADAKFADYWPQMKSAGLVRGAYQFFRARHDDNQQADLFVRTINAAGGLKAGDLPPVLDLEVDDGQTAAHVVSRALAWLKRVETKLGVRPIVYTGNNMSDTIGTAFKDYTLWVAHYTTDCPRIPAGWSTWTFWQNGEANTVPGIDGDADTDFFNGTKTQLDAITVHHAVATAAEIAEESPAASPRATPDGNAVMGDSVR